MEAAAIFIAILADIFLPMILFLSRDQQRAEQEKARARRLADARMNARLLRFNI